MGFLDHNGEETLLSLSGPDVTPDTLPAGGRSAASPTTPAPGQGDRPAAP